MQSDPIVAAVVLAAGSSTRMGKNKLLLELEGESLVRRAARTAILGKLAPVLVVLGHEADRVKRELEGLGVESTLNEEHAEGIRTSLRTGVEALRSRADALVVVLADMPFITVPMLESLVLRYRATRAPLVVSRYGEVEAPPTLYDRSLFSELASMTGERCAKQVARRHRNEAEFLDWPESALRDIDLAEDYAEVSAAWGRR